MENNKDPLSQMAKLARDLGPTQLDLTKFPRAATLLLEQCAWEWILDHNENEPEQSRLRLSLFTPLTPFARLEIPFILAGAVNFRDQCMQAVEVLEKASEDGKLEPNPAA